MSTVFRSAVESQETQGSQESQEKPSEVTGIVSDPENTPREVASDSLEAWELNNGKYGLSYLGIKEIGKTFPISMHFSQIDKYIKAEIAERGLDATPKTWQDILAEIEGEIGKEKDSYKRLQKLSDYLKVLSKLKNLKKLKEKYLQ